MRSGCPSGASSSDLEYFPYGRLYQLPNPVFLPEESYSTASRFFSRTQRGSRLRGGASWRLRQLSCCPMMSGERQMPRQSLRPACGHRLHSLRSGSRSREIQNVLESGSGCVRASGVSGWANGYGYDRRSHHRRDERPPCRGDGACDRRGDDHCVLCHRCGYRGDRCRGDHDCPIVLDDYHVDNRGDCHLHCGSSCRHGLHCLSRSWTCLRSNGGTSCCLHGVRCCRGCWTSGHGRWTSGRGDGLEQADHHYC